MSDERHRELIRLAIVLREIHHERYMSIHHARNVLIPLRRRLRINLKYGYLPWQRWYAPVWSDNVGNEYASVPPPIPLPGEW